MSLHCMLVPVEYRVVYQPRRWNFAWCKRTSLGIWKLNDTEDQYSAQVRRIISYKNDSILDPYPQMNLIEGVNFYRNCWSESEYDLVVIC